MDRVFFEGMELHEAGYNPDSGSGRPGKAGGEDDGGNRGDFVLCFAGVRINDRSIQLHCRSRNMKTLAAIPCHDEGLVIGSVVLKARKYVDPGAGGATAQPFSNE